MRKVLIAEYSELVIYLSCEVSPAYLDYWRAVITLVDAVVNSDLSVYLRRIKDELGADLAGKHFSSCIHRAG